MYYTREGTGFTGTPVDRDGKLYRPQFRRKCDRCGGAGGWQGWPGFTCYRCGGDGNDPKPGGGDRLYTREELDKLNERREKRRARAAERKAARLAAEWEALDEQFPLAVGVLTCVRALALCGERVGSEGSWSVLVDLQRSLFGYGKLSEAQADLAVKVWDETLVRVRERAEQDALRDAAPPVVEGRRVIEGEVVSVKWKEDQWGGKWVWTVREPSHTVVWGTIPSDLFAYRENPAETFVGRTVRFTATVTRSDRDDKFGFAKRPSKPEWVS